MAEVLIQGILCKYRDLRESSITEDGELIDGEDVLYSEFIQDEQYFRKTEHPFSDDELIAIANKELLYQGMTPIQKQWIDRENKRFEEGVYAYIDGVLTFIPGPYYCYVNYWTLEHGEKPEYREDDRLFFLFHEYLRLDTVILALTRLKGRRQGATSIAMFFMWFIAGRKEHMLCGTTSFNDGAAQDNFQKMFMYGFKAMLPCFQADFDSDSENFIRFVKPVEKKKKGVLAVKREGLNSYCDFKPNVISSYDSGRQSYNVPDEAGKRSKVNINSYWSRLYKTFLVGKNKVGFGYLPTTVGAKKEGGENYKLFYENSNQHKIDKETGEAVGVNTPNRCVRYFVPATRCYAGCIDKFGRSVEDDPEVPIMGNDGKMITEGSRTILLRERKAIEDNIAAGIGDIEQLMEHRRDYPLDEYDAFAFEAGTCEFNEENFKKQIEFLKANPDVAFWRRGRWEDNYDKEKKKLIVSWVDDPKGECWIKEFAEEDNLYSDTNGTIEPLNGHMYSVGADTYKNIFADGGSDGAISVVKKSCVIEGKETGIYPVFFFVGRPKLISLFNRQMFLTCLYFGAKVNVEIDAGTWFYEDFLEWDALQLLEWTPAVDLTKPKQKILPGTQSGNPFELAKQLEVLKIFYDGKSAISYNGNVHRVTFLPLLKDSLAYNHAERTPYHLTVSLAMALLPILGRPRPRGGGKPATKPESVLPRYKIKLSA